MSTIRIPVVVAQVIGLCHQSLTAAREYARSIAADPEAHKSLKRDFTDTAASISILLGKLDSRIPHSIWEQYKEQVVEADSLRLENIKELYIRMLPEQQEMLERAAEAILKKEFTIEETCTS